MLRSKLNARGRNDWLRCKHKSKQSWKRYDRRKKNSGTFYIILILKLA